MNDVPARNTGSQAVETSVFAERVDTLYDNLLTGQIITVVVALAIAAVARSTSGMLLTASWAAAMIAVAIIRGGMLYAYRKSPDRSDRARFWYRLFHAGLGAVSLLWVTGSLLFIPDLPDGAKTAMLMILVGMTAGAVAVLGADRGAYLLYAAALMLPPSILLGLAPDLHQKLLGILGCAYFIAMLVASNRYYVTLSQSLTLAFLNASLVDNLDGREKRNEEKCAELQQALTAIRAEHDKLKQFVKSQEALHAQRAAYVSASVQGMRAMLRRIEGHATAPDSRVTGAAAPEQILINSQLLLGQLYSLTDACAIGVETPALEHTPFSPRALIEALGETLDPVARQRRCSLTLVVDPALGGNVYGDPTRFSQILTVMAGGMTQLAGSGKIKIDARIISRKSERIVLRLTVGLDAGAMQAGMPEELQRLLRQNEIHASAFPETALTGIQTARRWVEAMNGRISADITGQGGPSLWAELQLDAA